MVQGSWLGGGVLQEPQASDRPQSGIRGGHKKLRRLPRDGLAQGAARVGAGITNVRGFLNPFKYSSRQKHEFSVAFVVEKKVCFHSYKHNRAESVLNGWTRLYLTNQIQHFRKTESGKKVRSVK